MQKIIEGVQQKTPHLFKFIRNFYQQCVDDRIAVTSGNLAYVTLLSLVPFLMVFFAILQAFPAFQSIKTKLEDFAFNNFVPAASDTIKQYVTEFASKASEMGAISILFLVVVALLLISNVDRTLNQIWRTDIDRRKIFTFAIYWMVLTLGPLLAGSSLVMTSFLISQISFAEEYTPGLSTFLLSLTPFLMSFGIYFILYMLVPDKPVKAKHAATGAVFAALLFELGKKVFALYVTSFPTYQVIYGALAAVPILFVWVYVSWIIVLLGAVFTVQVEKIEAAKKNLNTILGESKTVESDTVASETVASESGGLTEGDSNDVKESGAVSGDTTEKGDSATSTVSRIA